MVCNVRAGKWGELHTGSQGTRGGGVRDQHPGPAAEVQDRGLRCTCELGGGRSKPERTLRTTYCHSHTTCIALNVTESLEVIVARLSVLHLGPGSGEGLCQSKGDPCEVGT